MSDELAVIGAASAGAVARDIDGDGYLDGPCPNCGAELDGMYCHMCGQSARDMHRPFLTLIGSAIGDVFNLDGRIARTLPGLMFRPGHVTRAYLDGKRARYVPPFRLFLISSVLFFLILFSIGERQDWLEGEIDIGANTDALAEVLVDGQPLTEIDGFEDVFDDDGTIDSEAAVAFLAEIESIDDDMTDAQRERLRSAIESGEEITLSRRELFVAIQKWTPRLSLLLLPVYALIFLMMHFWVRRIYIYDHVIVALHFQTFVYFAAVLAILLSNLSGA